jgi:hypothetical protein
MLRFLMLLSVLTLGGCLSLSFGGGSRPSHTTVVVPPQAACGTANTPPC